MGRPGKIVVVEISLAVIGPPGIGFQGKIQKFQGSAANTRIFPKG